MPEMYGTHICFRQVLHSCKTVKLKLRNFQIIFKEHVPSFIVSFKDLEQNFQHDKIPIRVGMVFEICGAWCSSITHLFYDKPTVLILLLLYFASLLSLQSVPTSYKY